MKVGYARVSTFEQNLDLQMNALEKEGCDRIFCDQGESGAKGSRPEWDNCLDHLRKGDMLVIWKGCIPLLHKLRERYWAATVSVESVGNENAPLR